MKILKIVIRIIFGIVFTFSGFVKAVDPLGSAYMFTDYFTEAFGIPSLSVLSLTLSVVLNAFELLIGLCLIINVKPRLAALGGLIFMAFYTPLTLYIAIASPVQDCGCFGDAIIISNWETFFKNLVLLPMAIFLFYRTKGEEKTYKGVIDWSASVAIFAISIFFQLFSLNHLPIMDFRPYKVGTHIPDKMIIPEGEKVDSFATVIPLRNVTSNEVKEVDEATYMSTEEYWDDTKWKAEATISVLVKEGYKPPVYNFTAYPLSLGPRDTEQSVDMMDILLAEKNYSFLVIAYDLNSAELEGFDNMAELINYAYPKTIRAHLLTASTSNLIQFKQKIKFPVRFYNCDPITLKTVIRSNPGLVLMKEGTIVGKWHYNDIPSINEFESLINKGK